MKTASYTPDELLGQLNEVERKNAPKLLHVAGDAELLRAGRRVSVVGSRRVSDVGLKRARSLVKELVRRRIIVVSGLAAGIDTAAHTAAIEFGGRTVAVLGTPLDAFYPAENRALQQQIMSSHAVVSQFLPGYRMGTTFLPTRA